MYDNKIFNSYKHHMNTLRDGKMPECTPTTCKKNCCKSKEVFFVDEKNPLVFTTTKDEETWCNVTELTGSKTKYNTMLSTEEAERLLPKAEKYGITIIQRDIVDDTCIDIINQKIYPVTCLLLLDCLRSDNTGCALDAQDKPIVCGAYPFKLSQGMDELIDTKNCPQAMAIAANKETFDNILKIRENMWYKDNHMYAQMIHFMLSFTPIKLG